MKLAHLTIAALLCFAAHTHAQEPLSFSLRRSDEARNIIIPYDSNFLTFRFATLGNNAPDGAQYKFMLKGVDKAWRTADASLSATYTAVRPGRYIFTVISSDREGVWRTVGGSINIRVLPPPWRTWWAFTAYGLVFMGLLFLARREVIRRERLKNEVEMKRRESNTYQELDAIKSQFFANISHEFRTPLTLILAPVRKKLSSATSPEEREELAIVQRNAERLLVLVNELLDLSKLESGKIMLRLTNEDLVAVCDLTTSAFQPFAESRKISLSFEGPENNLVVRIDIEKFEKILGNLLSNALKFTPENGTVTVSVKGHGPSPVYGPNPDFPYGHAELVVSDSGVGIPVEEHEKVFNRFYQVDNSNTRAFGGTGIGLAMAKELIELHHGTIQVASAPGNGSKFTVRLPLSDSRMSPSRRSTVHDQNSLQYEPPAMAANHELSPQYNHTQTLLIIEDHTELRQYLQNNFQTTYRVLTAFDGEQGKEIAVAEIPDLVITDLMLPKLDGMEVCRALKGEEKTSHIPVVMLTARSEIKSRIEGLESGADDYIAKPFDFGELNARVENLLETRKRLREKFSKQLSVSPRPIETLSLDDQFLQKAIGIVEDNISNPSFSVDAFAKEAAMSSAQLYRKVTALTEFTPNDLIRHMRLQRAADLLRRRAGNVADVAYQSGFTSLSYFSKCFREKFGIVPSEYMKSTVLEGSGTIS